jgi:predicted RNA-binding protein YlqC (UPF0109 family)
MSLNTQLLNVVNDIEEINEQTAAINNSITTINGNIGGLGNNKQGKIQVTDTIQISKLKTQNVTMTLTGKDLQETLDGKQNLITKNDNFIIDSMYVTPLGNKTTVNPAQTGELRASILTVEDDTLGTINVGESINSLNSSKQDILNAGTNITIDSETNTISASGADVLSQTELDSKQAILNDISINEISAFKANLLNLNINNGIFNYNGNTFESLLNAKQTAFKTGATQSNNTLNVYEANILGGTSNFTLNGTTLQALLNQKQNSLTSSSNITTGTISSSTITVDGGSSIEEKFITSQVLTATANLIVKGTNVMTEIGTKQDKLTPGENITILDNIISAKNDGASALNVNSNIITGTIDSGTITGRSGTTIQAPTISATSDLLVGTTNIITELSNKQPILNAQNVNIITGTIDSGTITGRSGTTIQAPTILASSDLLVGTTNIITELGNKQQSLNQGLAITTGQIDCGPIVSRSGSKIQGPIIQALDNLLIGVDETDVLVEINKKQTQLTRTSAISINSLNVSSDTTSAQTKIEGQITCDSLLVNGVNINSSTGSTTGSTDIISFRAYALNTLSPGNKIDAPESTDSESPFPYEPLPFNLVEYNFGNAYNSTDYKFRAPNTGLYQVIVSVYYSDLILIDLLIEKLDGTRVRRDRIRSNDLSTTISSKSLTTIVYLQAGEKTFFALGYGSVYIGGVPRIDTSDTENNFGGFMVHYLGTSGSSFAS